MKPRLISALALVALTTTSFARSATAEEPKRAGTKGAVFLPFDFYPRHREALGLNEEQVREMQRVAETMRDASQKLEGERRERTKALHEATAGNAFEVDSAMERFQAVLEAENEMKKLQFRSGLAMRKLLTPEQTAKLESLAEKQSDGGGDANRAIRERLEQARAEIRKRAGSGGPPREVMERFKQIEQTVRQGKMAEAMEQLEVLLRQLREESGSRWSDEGKRREDSERRKGEIDEQTRSLRQKLDRAENPVERERLEVQLRKLSTLLARERGLLDFSNPKEGKAARERGNDREQRMREGGQSAKRADNHELRERLQGMLRRLNEAAESEEPEAIERIMRSIEPAVGEVSKDRRPQE